MMMMVVVMMMMMMICVLPETDVHFAFAMSFSACVQQQVFLLLTNGWIIRRVQCRGQACRLHAECYEKRVEDKPFY